MRFGSLQCVPAAFVCMLSRVDNQLFSVGGQLESRFATHSTVFVKVGILGKVEREKGFEIIRFETLNIKSSRLHQVPSSPQTSGSV